MRKSLEKVFASPTKVVLPLFCALRVCTAKPIFIVFGDVALMPNPSLAPFGPFDV